MTRTTEDSTWARRRSLLGIAGFSRSSSDGSERHGPRLLKKQHSKLQKSERTPSPLAKPETPDPACGQAASSPLSTVTTPDASELRRLSSSGKSRRSSNMIETLRSIRRSNTEDSTSDSLCEPLSATSTAAPSLFTDASPDSVCGAPPLRRVIQHGEVQTSSGMFRKRREHLVLTESHLVRYRSQAKAAEAWRVIPMPGGRPAHMRHGSMSSTTSLNEIQSQSDASGDKQGRVSLRQVIAVQKLEDSKPFFALEVAYLDDNAATSSSLLLQFAIPEERDRWLTNIRYVTSEARLQHERPLSTSVLEHVARIVERDSDYDPTGCAIYKVVQRPSAMKTGRTSTDDMSKLSSTACLFAIGMNKVHIVQFPKAAQRNTTPSTAAETSQVSYGILALTAMRVSSDDDTFELTFREPLQKPVQLFLASHAAHEIVTKLQQVEASLRPEWGFRMYKVNIPRDVDNLSLRTSSIIDVEHSGLDRTMAAYCIAYGENPSDVRYTVIHDCEDAPRFELWPPSDPRRSTYGPLTLLAIMRALRYNENFVSISFANISLDCLNELHDYHGSEHVCLRTKRGTAIKLPAEELAQSSLLVQEVRALAATNKKLRRMDFSDTISDKSVADISEILDEDTPKAPDNGCGIVEALVPLCRQQTTNVDWICLNGIKLSDRDMDYLVSAAVDKLCHFRAIELNRCGLNDRNMGLILDALRAQDNTIEAIEIGGNVARLYPIHFDGQLSVFGFIRKLNLSYVPRTSGNEPLLTAETLLIWRLQELRFSGTALNQATIDAVATYLAHPQSITLHELYFDNSYLSGGDVATLLRSLSYNSDHSRDLHLDISQNRLTKDLDEVTRAIAEGFTPSRLSMRAIEYRDEVLFQKMLAALTVNKTISYLDMSQTALPGHASQETCQALYKLLAENDTLLDLDLSGEDSRLALTKFGAEINQAILGLKLNKSLQIFRIEKQKLGVRGASTLAEVLKENQNLRELHCANNEIPLHGFTDLINSLVDNKTLVYLPPMEDGREAALRTAEITMKAISSDLDPPLSPRKGMKKSPQSLSGGLGVKRGFASVRRSAARTASNYTPAFHALPSSSHTSNRSPYSFPDKRASAFGLVLPTGRARTNSSASAIGLNPSVAPTISFSSQDIQTTHRLLSEQWDRQAHRLTQYLNRNWCLLNDIPVNMDIEDDRFEHPAAASTTTLGATGAVSAATTVMALDKILESPASATQTPRKDMSLSDLRYESGAIPFSDTLADDSNRSTVGTVGYGSLGIDAEAKAPSAITAKDGDGLPRSKRGSSFKQFILGSDSTSTSTSDDCESDGEYYDDDEDEDEGNVGDPNMQSGHAPGSAHSTQVKRKPVLRVDTTLEMIDAPKTPTRAVIA